MEFVKKHFSLIIFCLIVLASIVVLLLYRNTQEENYYEQDSDLSLKKYEVNEYIPVNISYDQMARIYLQDYVYKLLYDIESAYELVDYEYKKTKFPTLDDFKEYISGIMSAKTREMSVVKFAVTDKNDYRDFDVYDANDNLFIFRESGVLEYKVYFDRSTVNMK